MFKLPSIKKKTDGFSIARFGMYIGSHEAFEDVEGPHNSCSASNSVCSVSIMEYIFPGNES